MTTINTVRSIHRYKLHPAGDGTASVQVGGLDPVFLTAQVDLSGDISAWFEVGAADVAEEQRAATKALGVTEYRFAVLPTGAEVPSKAEYHRTVVLPPGVILHVYLVPSEG